MLRACFSVRVSGFGFDTSRFQGLGMWVFPKKEVLFSPKIEENSLKGTPTKGTPFSETPIYTQP